MNSYSVEATAQAWDVLVGLLNIAVKSAGLDVAENSVYWLKTIQGAAQAAAVAQAAAEAKDKSAGPKLVVNDKKEEEKAPDAPL